MDQRIASAASSPVSSPFSSPPSSPLSMLSRSPSLPPSPPFFALNSTERYPSPSATSQSGGASPRKPADADMAGDVRVRRDRDRNGDGLPPAKRRRVHPPPRPRMTRHIDLERPSREADEELTYLLQALRKKKRIVVVAGAGISVSAGIPDFRSSTGLFTTLRGQHGSRGSGKHLFDASVYKHDSSTSSFHSMVRELAHMTQAAKPTPFHHMLASMAHEGRLMRLYSQNVDCIETNMKPLATNVPLNTKGPWPATIQLHGGLAKMVCSKCGQLEDFDGSLFEGPEPPPCGQCAEMDHLRTSMAGKRSHGIGRLRPRIVLYNEYNPDEEAIGNVSKADLRRGADAVIVVGTSLKIPGVRRLVKELCQVTRSRRDGFTAWINLDAEPQGAEFKDCWDLVVRGSSDDVARLAALPRWDDQDVGSPRHWSVTGLEVHRPEKLEVVLESKSPLSAAFGGTSSAAPATAKPIKQEGGDVKPKASPLLPRLGKPKSLPKPLHASSPGASIPTPIPSPKPQRTRLPDKPTPGLPRQSKLPFQQVKKSDVSFTANTTAKDGLKTGAKSELPSQRGATLGKLPAKKARQGQVSQQPTRKPRQPKSKPKREEKMSAKSLALTFRSTKLVADSTTAAGKKRTPLPSGKAPAESNTSNRTTDKHAGDQGTSMASSDVSDLSSPPDSVERQLRADMIKLPSLRECANASNPCTGKENDYSHDTFCRLLDDKLRQPSTASRGDHQGPRTPPASQSRRSSDAAETISPMSKPRGMGSLID
ncbi:sir2 family histone deacetylase [Niveomyces insectorum RCEF 264]|uniref:Sir2 family histone deacetylase n=1 Tax=Niveomyces insectorum RCEF 264 TaxID=1081102 RepID=A0A167U578_9HYPO|nr:sir2 family histone deacetylase [Niveomyces insectorum RCEF 264]